MKNKQHVQLPKKSILDEITTQDQLVYVSIKRHQNKDTKLAFPSIDKIKEHTGLSKPTILKCIKNLESAGYLTIIKTKGKPNQYGFPKYDEFEVFGYDFLDNANLSTLEKQYILATQQYMYKHQETKTGISTYSNKELSDLTGLSMSSINRCNRTLQQHNYLNIIKTKAREIETGLNKDAKIFHLDSIGNEIVFTLCDHEERIMQNTQDIEKLKIQMQSLLKQNELLLKENRELKKDKFKTTEIVMD